MPYDSGMMNTNELLSEAWKAVEEAGVPGHLQETAFKEAVQYLKEAERAADVGASTDSGIPRGRPGRARGTKAPEKDRQNAAAVTASDFFSRLATESGVEENELRQVLRLDDDGRTVKVDQPTRQLGSNKAAQARTVTVLVSGARFGGLDEHPVSASAVRTECDRKRCYDNSNYAKHVGSLKGFNMDGRDKVVVNPKWVEEFDEAVGRLLERPADDDN